MARTRSIKPGFFKNELLAMLPPYDQLLFIGLWTLADREGRLEDRPMRIKAELFPYADVDVQGGLLRLANQGFILRYSGSINCAYISIPTWSKHQNPHFREQDSIIPPLNQEDVQALGLPQSSPVQAVPSTLPPVLPSTLPPVASPAALKRKVPTEEIDIAATAVKLHQRHPANGCGISEIKKHLKTIVGKSSTDKRAELLELIDRNHAAWCETQGWRDGYAKGLANWLSPTMERWKDPPSENRQMRKPDWTTTLETGDERWARLEREDAAKAAQAPARGIL